MKNVLYVCTVHAMVSYSSRILEVILESKVVNAYAVIFISYHPSKSFAELQQEYGIAPQYLHKVLFLPFPKSRIWKNLWPMQYVKAVTAFASAHAIEHIHFLTQDTIFAMHLSRLGNRQLYYTVHDLVHHERDLPLLQRLRKYFFIKRRDKKLVQCVSRLVTSSRHQYESLRNSYPHKQVYYHKMPSLVTRRIMHGVQVVPELQGVNKYLLFFGRIEKYKGVEYLFDAFAGCPQLRDFYLVIAGSGKLYDPLRRKTHERVIFINRFIGDGEIKNLFSRAYCLVLPYISATQSSVSSLAYYHNIPVLASDIDGLRDTIIDRQSGLLFSRKNTEDLRSKLLEIATDEHLYSQICRRQRELWNYFFDDQSLRSSLEALYDS